MCCVFTPWLGYMLLRMIPGVELVGPRWFEGSVQNCMHGCRGLAGTVCFGPMAMVRTAVRALSCVPNGGSNHLCDFALSGAPCRRPTWKCRKLECVAPSSRWSAAFVLWCGAATASLPCMAGFAWVACWLPALEGAHLHTQGCLNNPFQSEMLML
jgi:hypothetical protein